MLLPNSTGMVETYFFFSLGRLCVCVCARWLGSCYQWDMGHDRLGSTSASVWHGSLFLFIHFSAYTEKDQGGWVWVGLGCWFITFFLFFLERMYGSLRFRVV